MRAERAQQDSARAGFGVLAGLIAGLIYAVGLLAPLTPSEGLPTPVELGLFAALPLAMVAVGSAVTRSVGVRTMLIAEAGGIVGFTLYLLRLQGAF